jgi:hypothetical protein
VVALCAPSPTAQMAASPNAAQIVFMEPPQQFLRGSCRVNPAVVTCGIRFAFC